MSSIAGGSSGVAVSAPSRLRRGCSSADEPAPTAGAANGDDREEPQGHEREFGHEGHVHEAPGGSQLLPVSQRSRQASDSSDVNMV